VHAKGVKVEEQFRAGYVAIGHIAGPHGILGEVRVVALTDHPERFRPGVEVYLGNDEDVRPVVIQSARPHKDVLLVKLREIDDRNAAELLRDHYLLIPEGDAMPLGEHENYVHDLIGLSVQTASGEPLGKLVEVLETKANDVYVVSGPQGELLLPALRSVVQTVDLITGTMIVEVPDGLRDRSSESKRLHTVYFPARARKPRQTGQASSSS